MKVLISAPSLDEKENVSGVSQVVKQIYKTENVEFVHFQIGSPDHDTGFGGKIIRNLSAIGTFLRHMLKGGVDIYHSNTALNHNSIVRDLIFIWLGRLFGKRILLHLHGGRYVSDRCTSPRWLKAIRFICARAHRVVVLGRREADSIRDWYGVDESVIRILNNCIDETDIAGKREPRATDEPVSLLFLGRIAEEKGVQEIVDAFDSPDRPDGDFRLVICGDGPLREGICGALQQSLGDKFDYRGVVSGGEKQQALDEADYLLLPSRYGEGMPIALLEAMGAGIVPIITDMSSVREVVGEKAGIYVQPQDVPSLQKALRRAIDRDIDWSEISDQARNRIRTDFGCSRMRHEMRIIYDELVALS